MRNILRPLKSRIPQIILVIIFLIVQAYCNLTLPSYTADIVNIGIQNADIDYIMNTGMMMLAMVGISVLAAVFLSYFSSRISSGYAKDLRKIVYRKVLKFFVHKCVKKITNMVLICALCINHQKCFCGHPRKK